MHLPAASLGAESLLVNSTTIAGNTCSYQKLSTFLHKEAMNSLSNGIDVTKIPLLVQTTKSQKLSPVTNI